MKKSKAGRLTLNKMTIKALGAVAGSGTTVRGGGDDSNTNCVHVICGPSHWAATCRIDTECPCSIAPACAWGTIAPTIACNTGGVLAG